MALASIVLDVVLRVFGARRIVDVVEIAFLEPIVVEDLDIEFDIAMDRGHERFGDLDDDSWLFRSRFIHTKILYAAARAEA